MPFDGKGIYIITYAYALTYALDMLGPIALFDDGSAVTLRDASDKRFTQLWLINDSIDGESDTYTIRNLYWGGFLNLKDSSIGDGTPITAPKGSAQKWVIKKNGGNKNMWKIRNKASETFVDLKNGDMGREKRNIVGWHGSWNDSTSLGHQNWHFERVSMTGSQLVNLTRNDSFVDKIRLNSYDVDELYLLLPRSKISEIYEKSGLANRGYRYDIYDCEDFALAMKVKCIEWGNEYFDKADDFAIMCGLMSGIRIDSDGVHAYNWFVDRDTQEIVYFEPQSGVFKGPGGDAPQMYKGFMALV